MANFNWGAVGSVIHLLTTTQLNGLASGSGSALGPEVGAVNNPQLGMFHLQLASNSNAYTATSSVTILFLSSIDTATGSAYPTYTSGASYKLAYQNYDPVVMYINPATQSANVVDETKRNIILPLGFFKTVLINNSGFNIPNGSILDFYPTPSIAQ